MAVLIYIQCFPDFSSLNTKALNIGCKGLMDFKKFVEIILKGYYIGGLNKYLVNNFEE